MGISTNNFKKVLSELFKNNQDIFYNEREFQIILKQKLKEKFVDAEIFLECMFPIKDEINGQTKERLNYVDIIIYHNKKIYPVELKYNAWGNNKCLAGASDCNIHRCNFLEDIILTEKTIEQHNLEYGYCIFLTNNKYLYEDKNETKITKDLKIFDGRKIESGKCYERKGSNNNLRVEYIFKNSYKLNWNEIENNDFKFLIVSIENKPINQTFN